MKRFPLLLGTCCLALSAACRADVKLTDVKPTSDAIAKERARDERLSFQSLAPWSPRTHIDADVAMVYGIDPSLPERIKTWRDKGYRIHVMTGVAWGEYQDYLFGKFDGKNHEDESQTDRAGNIIGHGVNIPYMSPSESYGRFLTVGVKRALDAGAEAIHLEEPEFWVRSGYEPSFKREWKAFYGEDWTPINDSPDAQYRASKLKYFLYQRALSQVFTFVKQYGKEHGRDIKCYVPTHSLINYAHWGIVSPESSLLDVGCDGYIAQVWTGTAREPNSYEGRVKERTFETAYLEYSSMQNLVRASGRRVWYLNDPIEDNADHSWTDYRTNWESTLVASLLQPEVWHYEVMPWPQRIWEENYPVKERSQRKAGEPTEKVPIPPAYETELQSVMRALGEMKQPAKTVGWQKSGTRGVGVLVSDTMMFQRADPMPSDSRLGSFYGLAMPLLKRGLPVEPVQIESATASSASTGKDFLKPYRVLLLTYEGQKPPTPAFHTALAKWVREGGSLIVLDNDGDPYNAVRDWWNKAPLSYKTPREHLFETLGIDRNFVGSQKVGKGFVMRSMESPADLSHREDGGELVRSAVKEACAAVKVPWTESNALVLKRGPYIVASGLDESVPGAPTQTLRGRFIDLFDANLAVLPEVALAPGKRAYLFDLNAIPAREARVVAAACRVRNEVAGKNTLRFDASGVAETRAVVRAVLPAAPKHISVAGKPLAPSDYAFSNGVLGLRFPNAVESVPVEISW
ncbi:hypothetical protein B1R32_11180 [Abditibacterium utsteinense]|uniref:Glycoside hydrolase family 42 N-terminal domain-containing protein n=1 Tax=Abditibacterium utsteinense TaxID=1960156 RepID=A0A2S8SS02_9BACT|nr:hypothetical protein [Abditibacterium utsteinense]PQV63519.1 hypothetical protein B1R32_11180 [Abditibacterium utsteinense]